MAFERFTRAGRSYAPKVSIWQRGQIGFNSGAMGKFKLSKYDYAVLFFDKEARKIGIKFTTDAKEAGALKIIKGKTGAFISAKPFLDFYEIPHPKTVKYDVEYDKTDEIYIIDINRGTDNG